MKSSGALITLTSASEPSFTVIDKESLGKIRLNQKSLLLATEYRLTNEDEIAFGDVIVTFVMDEEISATPICHRIRNRPERDPVPPRSAVILESSDDSSDTDCDIPNSCPVRKEENDSVFWNSGRPPSIVRLLLEDTGPDINEDTVKVKNEEVDVHEALTQQSVSLSCSTLSSATAETQEIVSVPNFDASDSEEEFAESQSLLPSTIDFDGDGTQSSVYDALTQVDAEYNVEAVIPKIQTNIDSGSRNATTLDAEDKENDSDRKGTAFNIYDALTQPDCPYEKVNSTPPPLVSRNIKQKSDPLHPGIYEALTQPDCLHERVKPTAPPLTSHNAKQKLGTLHPEIYDALTQPNTDIEEAYFLPTQLTPPPPQRCHASEMVTIPVPERDLHYGCTQDVLNDLVEPSPPKKSIEIVFATPLDRVKRAVRRTTLIPLAPDFSVSSLDLSSEADNGENYYDATQDILADLQSQKMPEDAVRPLGDRSALPSKNILMNLVAMESRDMDEESDGSASPLLSTSLTSLDSQEISRLAPASPTRVPPISDVDVSAEENSEPLVFRRSAPFRRKKSPSPPPPTSRASKRARRAPARLADTVLVDKAQSPSAQPSERKRKKNENTRCRSPRPHESERRPAAPRLPTKAKAKPVDEIIPSPPVTLKARTSRSQTKKPANVTENSRSIIDSGEVSEKRSTGRTRSSGASPVTRIMLTGINGERLPDIVRKLGGEVVTVDGQVLVADTVRRTFKLLMAAARGIPVVSPDWLVKSGRASRFLDTGLYTYKDVGDTLSDRTFSGRRFPIGGCSILKDYLIFVTPGSKLPPDEIKQLLETLKGTAVLVKDGSPNDFHCKINKTHRITISSERERRLWRHSPHPVHSADFIINAALTHSLSLISSSYLER